MSEHQIRLRKAWEIQGIGEDAADWEPIDLPTRLDRGAGAFRLRRGFRPPRIDPSRERLRLELRRVAGLRRVRLAGRMLGEAIAERDRLVLDVPPDVPARAVLELEIDPTELNDAGRFEDWGHVALVVVDAGAPGDTGASTVAPKWPDPL
jgi:hypothetical protein